MSSTSPDLRKIDWLLMHAVEHVYPSREALREKFLQGGALTLYLGIDPTGPTLHLGHAVPLQKLAEFQELGHKVILLIGDFTALIGDPTDKLATRKQQTREEVIKNCKLYKEQASRFISFTGKNPAQLKFNNDWLGKMVFKDVVELASHVTVQQMLERDMFEKRMSEGKPIHLHEFLYPLMQGYDSIAMNVDIEVCGNDQTFNALAGRALMREIKGKEKFVLTTRLLSDATGKKMGKTEGNMISLTDAPEDMYGKVMSWTDEMIVPGFEICTKATLKEIEELKHKLAKGENPMTFKRELAHRIVIWLAGGKEADLAAEAFRSVHQKGEKPETMEEIEVKEERLSLIDALLLSRFVPSKSEARRQIQQGGIKVDDKVVSDVNAIVTVKKGGTIIQKGKRFFVRLIL